MAVVRRCGCHAVGQRLRPVAGRAVDRAREQQGCAGAVAVHAAGARPCEHAGRCTAGAGRDEVRRRKRRRLIEQRSHKGAARSAKRAVCAVSAWCDAFAHDPASDQQQPPLVERLTTRSERSSDGCGRRAQNRSVRVVHAGYEHRPHPPGDERSGFVIRS
ncbi:hypothetical protein XHV734_3435 [Xanthomonas hortorum pv. vitians]|nr:hypothetical protein XHV734_3435 [Xanthomonas hortorum pv. vitians]